MILVIVCLVLILTTSLEAEFPFTKAKTYDKLFRYLYPFKLLRQSVRLSPLFIDPTLSAYLYLFISGPLGISSVYICPFRQPISVSVLW